jgi:hypothetical protein
MAEPQTLGKEMNLFCIVTGSILLLCSGCASVAIEKLSADEKREVQPFLAPAFKFPAGKEEETYSLVYAAQRRVLIDGTLIREIEFKDSTHATIFIKAAPGSMHGGPSIHAVWDEGEWKFGNWLFPV